MNERLAGPLGCQPMAELSNVVVVGASLAGLRSVESLRRQGFAGPITLIGSEPHLPYDRPPLSKDVLRGETEPDELLLRRPPATWDELRCDLRLGRTAIALDPLAQSVTLDDDAVLSYRAGGCIVATGASVRTLPDTPDFAGIFTLRTLDDALALRGALDANPDARVVVVGAGFIGSEVASSCRARGHSVTVLEALPVPLERVLGAEMGAACGALHGANGVELRCGTGVAGFTGAGPGGRVSGVRLSDASVVPAEIVVVGVGVAPNTGWLAGSGVRVDNGVVCDSACRVLGDAADHARPLPGLVAAGDVARWYNPLFGTSMRIEHWTNAVEMAEAAAGALLADAEADGAGDADANANAGAETPPAREFAPVPYFWSDQYGVKIQFAGWAQGFDEMAVVDGDVADGRFVAIYGRAGLIVGALAFSRPRLLMKYRGLIARAAPWDEARAMTV